MLTLDSWLKSSKRQNVEGSNAPGVSVCEVARGYDLDSVQLFAWRKKFGMSVEASVSSKRQAAFVAVEVTSFQAKHEGPALDASLQNHIGLERCLHSREAVHPKYLY